MSQHYPFSVTCETHDEAVVHCLSALSHFAEHFDPSQVEARAGANGLPTMPSTKSADDWVREDGRVTFRFSDQRRRGTFLGEATRLLSGKWTRIALGDDELVGK